MPWIPELRSRLIETLTSLSDPEYQQRVWIENRQDPGMEACLDEDIHFVFDDSCLADDPSGAIGHFLRNQGEAVAITGLVIALDRTLEDVGPMGSDAEYIASPHWPQVLQAAQEALLLVRQNEQRAQNLQ